MNTTPPKESPWRRGLPPIPVDPKPELAEKRRSERVIMNSTKRRDRAARTRENDLAGRIANGGRHT